MTQTKTRQSKTQSKSTTAKIPRHCQHVMTNGEYCRAMALRDRRYCHFHLVHRGRQLRARHMHDVAASNGIGSEYMRMDMPVLEDANAIQMALSHVADAVMNHAVDPKRAGLVLYALQIATLNFRNGVDFRPSEDAVMAEQYEEFEQDFQLGDFAPELKGETATTAAAQPSADIPGARKGTIAPTPDDAGARKPAIPLDPASIARIMQALPRIRSTGDGKVIERREPRPMGVAG